MGGRLRHFAKSWQEVTHDHWVLSVVRNGYSLEFTSPPPVTFYPPRFLQVSALHASVLEETVQGLLAKNAIRLIDPASSAPGFYNHMFLVPKKTGGVETDSQPTRTQQVPQGRVFRHGDKQGNHGGGAAERLVSLGGPQGCLFSYSNPRGLLAVPPVLGERPGLRTYGPPLWSSHVPSSVYAGSARIGGFSASPVYSVTPVSRRLADAQPKPREVAGTSRSQLVGYPSSRFYSELGKVRSHSRTRFSVSRNEIMDEPRNCLPNSGTNRQFVVFPSFFYPPFLHTGAHVASRLGYDGVDVGNCSLGTSTCPTNSIVSSGALETSASANYSIDSGPTQITVSPNVVVGPGEFIEGGSPQFSTSQQVYVHRCFQPGLGSASGRADCVGHLVGRPVQTTHKLARAASSVSSPSVVSAVRFPPECASQHGQLYGGRLHKQNGGDQVPVPMLSNVGPSYVVQDQRCGSSSTTFTGQAQSHCGLFVPGSQSDFHRVGDSSAGGQPDLCDSGRAQHGLVCHVQQPQTATFCVASSRPKGSGSRRVVHALEKSPSVRFSAVSSSSSCATQNRKGRDYGNSSRTVVAQEAVVSDASRLVGGRTSATPSARGSVVSGASSCSPRPERVRSSRVQVVERSLLASGFSQEAAAVIARPQRSSTLAVYEDKWSKFCDWCGKRSIDPLKVSVNQLAEFFLFLFKEKGFSPGTVAVYRTALSATIRGVGGQDFSHNAALSAMIRNFRIEKPVQRKLVPQWSLSLVLRGLQEPPFEPLQSISLKALTFKTAFLLALASGSRRSEIHAFGVSAGLLTISKTEVVLRTSPGFLYKNQVLGSVPEPVSVKALDTLTGPDPQERFLCPVRSLRWYLKRTDAFRAGRTRLFLPIPPSAKKDISSADVSRWIAGTVRWVYAESSDVNLRLSRVSAHEVRALAASWAYASGVPSDEFLKAGTWRSANSFVSFYLRDMASEADGLFSLGPLSVSQQVISGK